MTTGGGPSDPDVVMDLAAHRRRTAALLEQLDALRLVVPDGRIISAGATWLRSTDEELGQLVSLFEGGTEDAGHTRHR
jgi:hypothetical protein